MSAMEIFVWGIEDMLGVRSRVAESIARIIDTADIVGLGEIVVDGAVELTEEFKDGVTEVIDQMKVEKQQRLQLEQEGIRKLREERVNAFSKMNAYIENLVELSTSDKVLENVAGTQEANENIQSLIRKREEKIFAIRKLRENAIKSNDIEEIVRFAEMAEKIYEGFSGEVQSEIVYFARKGIKLKGYGTLHEDAIKMALAKKNDVASIKIMALENGQSITEAMIRYDFNVFEDCLYELLCEEGLNDRHLRDIFAIKQDLSKLKDDKTISLEIKKKRIATLFGTFTKRQQSIKAELKDMALYYEAYLKATIDMADERLDMSEFSSVEEIIQATTVAKKALEAQFQKEYVQLQVDRVMKKHGLNIVDSAVMGRKEDDKRVLYGIDDSAAVDVFVSDNGMLSTKVVGINFGEEPSATEEAKLIEKEHKFCSKMVEIEDDLEKVGIILRKKKSVPPGTDGVHWIQLDKSTKVEKKKTNNKKRRQTNNKVMYMERGL